MNDIDTIKIRLAIEELNAAFVHHLDHNDLEALIDLFAADALYTHGERRCEGRAAIRSLFSARAAAGPRTTRHFYSGLRIHIHSEAKASGRCVCMAFAADEPPPVASTAPHLVADFLDEYVCDADAKWRIARRDIQRIFVSPSNSGPVGR